MRAVLTLISIMTLAGAVETVSVVTAIVSACLQTTVVTRESRFTVALATVGVAFTITTASVGALLFTTVSTTVVGSTETSSVEALSVFLVTALTQFVATIGTRESFIAMTDLGPFITNAIATAIIGADFSLCLALKTNKTGRTQAVSFTALSTIGNTVLITGLVCACCSLPTNLAKASCIITAVTVFAIRTHRLRTVNATITNITFALASHAIATSVARATVGAHLLLTRLPHETRCTVACSVNATTML